MPEGGGEAGDVGAEGGTVRGGPRRHVDDEARVARILAEPSCPEWEKLVDELVSYAHRRIEVSILRGTIYEKAARANGGHPVLGLCRVPEGLILAGHDATILADDMVQAAVRTFQNRLSSWDPQAGRSLRSYFFTWCLFKLPDAYKSWCRREADDTTTTASLDAAMELAAVELSPEEHAELDDLLRRAAQHHPEGLQIVLLQWRGFSGSEIRERMGGRDGLMSEGKVKRLLAELRKWLQGEESADG